MSELLVRKIDEHIVDDKRTGRHVEHDPQSKSYRVRKTGTLRSRTHRRYTPILNQGNKGSCTGNASCGMLGTAPFYGTLRALRTVGLTLDEPEAVNIYSLGTKLDNVPGSYPPDDTGSTGLGVSKAMKQLGLISSYDHCFDLNDVIYTLQQQPVIGGFNWYDSMDDPDWYGQVHITPGASVRGGHEWLIRSVNLTKNLLGCDNSWGPDWGKNGSFTISFNDFERLMSEQGDVTVPRPLNYQAA